MKKVYCCALFILSFACQGCFELVEQIYLKNDGSGNLQVVLNMSRSKTKLNSISKMKTINGHDVPRKEDITEKTAAIEKAIRKTAGISNVKTMVDFDNYIATLSCNFKKIENLNNAIDNVSLLNNKKNTATGKSYEYDIGSKTFSRRNNFPIKTNYEKMSSADKEIFAGANYTCVFRFENAVATAGNKESNIAANKKAVMLKMNMLDILLNKKSIENKITF